MIDFDVTSDASVNAAASAVHGKSGAADVVVNSAGQMFVGITEAFTADELATQLDINVVGVRRVIEHVRDQNWTAIGIDFPIVSVAGFPTTGANMPADRAEEQKLAAEERLESPTLS